MTPPVPDKPSSNPFTTPIGQQVKAFGGLVLAGITAAGVALPDSGSLKLAAGIIGALLTYMTVYGLSNSK